ncbi:hypothetical protein GCM10020295_56070 [Streptomyces cinereospinus]
MDRTTHVTDRPARSAVAYDPGARAGTPHLRAARVLAGNWTGTSTVPSRALYPHQWSWDSGFVAIGLRHLSPLRAQTELETLLAAQWGDGRIPHIVFNPSVPLDAYFPSPDFWRSSTAGRAAAPRAPYRPPASCSHRCTRWRRGWCTAPTRGCRGRAASSPGCTRGWRPGTGICCTGGTWAAPAWRR